MPPEHSRRRIRTAGAGATASAALAGPLSSQASAADLSPGRTRPTIVLVHCGFADASCWNGVIERLQHAGYPIMAPADPLRSLPINAAYLAGVLQSISGPIVLVGHSYGGAVVTDAVIEVPGASHVAMMSHPGIATRLIETAAAAGL